MHGSQGPDLLGICEIENKDVAETLMSETGHADYELAHGGSLATPDRRGEEFLPLPRRKAFSSLRADPSHAFGRGDRPSLPLKGRIQSLWKANSW